MMIKESFGAWVLINDDDVIISSNSDYWAIKGLYDKLRVVCIQQLKKRD